MLIPVCNERLPVRLEICVSSARNLPVMNKSINSTDAFVEVRFLETVEKTDVVTSLNPFWNSDPLIFDTDEKEISEEWLQFRVMDHDTYSANDAIGRVNVDCNIFLERLRMTRREMLEETFTLKIYDTIYGNRGDLTVNIRMHLLIPTNMSNYVQIFSGSTLPSNLRLSEIFGIVDNIRCEKDPDYEWLDKIRTPRATNEARQSAIRATLRDAIMGIALKTHKMGGNVIIGFQEYVDMEGSCSDLLTCRVLGTAIKVVSEFVNPLPFSRPVKAILTIDKVPCDRQIALGPLLTARSIKILDEDEDPETVRKNYWISLRSELYQQARSVGCNLVVAYTEKICVNEGVALLTCTGTAVQLSDGTESAAQNIVVHEASARNSPITMRDVGEKEQKEQKKTLFKFNGEGKEKRSDSTPRIFRCSQFHLPKQDVECQAAGKTLPCAYCRTENVGEFIVSTQQCPPSQYYAGPKNFIQVSVCKKISSDANETSNYADDIGNALPYSDHELIGSLLNEAKNVYPSGNAIFGLDVTNSICDDSLVCIVTGVLVRLLVIQKAEAASPSITNVLSFSSLQRQHDARRFSWGTVRDAIRFKPTIQSSLTLKILNIKQPIEDNTSTSAKSRLRLNTIVDKVRRKQHKEYVTHVVFERHMSLSIGVHESQSAGNSSNIAGVHLSANLYPHFINRENVEGQCPIARFSDVFVREDLTTAVRDSTSVDGFVTNALEERITAIKSTLSLAGTNSIVANMKLSCPQFNVSKEHAHIILLVSVDFYSMP